MKSHWDDIFTRKSGADLGWYEGDMQQSLKWLDACGELKHKTVFLAGSGTGLLPDTLLAQGVNIIANDISLVALEALQSRLQLSPALKVCHQSLGEPLYQAITVDVWFDRAVLHFLLDAPEIAQYFENIRRSVKVGGFVVLAEFAKGGASKCAGLPIRQYDLETFKRGLGDDFELVSAEHYSFINPVGDEKPYVYGLFRRLK